jgi:hypothetical protein
VGTEGEVAAAEDTRADPMEGIIVDPIEGEAIMPDTIEEEGIMQGRRTM